MDHGDNNKSDGEEKAFVDSVEETAKEALGAVGDKAKETLDAVSYSAPVSFAKDVCSFGKFVTAPAWGPLVGIYKAAAWGVKKTNNSTLKNTIIGTAICLGGSYAAAFTAAATYGSLYGYVKANDMSIPVMNWPATQGSVKGDFFRWSHKGTFPCDSWEGGIRTGDAATVTNFAVRTTDTVSVAKMDKIFNSDGTAEVILSYNDNALSQEEFGEVVNHPKTGEFEMVKPTPGLGCIQHFDHTGTDMKRIGLSPN